MENSTATDLAGLRVNKQLAGLNACLFTHAEPKQAQRVAQLSGPGGLGAVYSVRGPNRRTLQQLAELHRARVGDLSALLVDASRYAGERRALFPRHGRTRLDR